MGIKLKRKGINLNKNFNLEEDFLILLRDSRFRNPWRREVIKLFLTIYPIPKSLEREVSKPLLKIYPNLKSLEGKVSKPKRKDILTSKKRINFPRIKTSTDNNNLSCYLGRIYEKNTIT